MYFTSEDTRMETVHENSETAFNPQDGSNLKPCQHPVLVSVQGLEFLVGFVTGGL